MNIDKQDLSLIANTIRALSIDAIQKANSGHPGMPMGTADIATVLWTKFLNHTPDNLLWPNRDRFVLSPGHGSMLLYSLLHLSGYKISIDDIKNFRQLGSLTPGHPENYVTDGVETTTGPLGQGFANGVGMAYAEKFFESEFNQNEKIIDHYIYGIVSDGDLMEGISYESASIAGEWQLGNIIYLYDSNNITIEGNTDIAFVDDIEKRFLSVNWHVQKIDGHNYEEIEKAIIAAQKEKNRPSIIIAKTEIAHGSPNKKGSASSHGSPLGEDEVRATKRALGLDENKFFYVPESVYTIFNQRNKEIVDLYTQWQEKFDKIVVGELKTKWDSFFEEIDFSAFKEKLPSFEIGSSTASRAASGKVIEALFESVPNFIGGSADLAPSNKTFVKGYSESGHGKIGRNIHFGIREHAMGAIQNGMAYYGGLIPYSATFFVFMDYMRPAIRLAALARLQSIYVFTHDSFYVGEDGPTHQPVEHLLAARTIPNLNVLRPADGTETVEAWISAIKRKDGPSAIILTRQNLPEISRERDSAENLHKGAYVIWQDVDDAEVDFVILSSGSEVNLAIDGAKMVAKNGKNARVVSFPSWELFDEQSDEYKNSVLMANLPCVVIEAGLSMGWERYSGRKSLFITMDGFGTSGAAVDLAEKYGFTPEKVAKSIDKFLS